MTSSQKKNGRAQLRRSMVRPTRRAAPDPGGNRAERRAAEREQRKHGENQ